MEIGGEFPSEGPGEMKAKFWKAIYVGDGHNGWLVSRDIQRRQMRLKVFSFFLSFLVKC